MIVRYDPAVVQQEYEACL